MRITSSKCAIELDQNGRAVLFENFITGEKYSIADSGEYLIAGDRKYESGICREIRENDGEVEFVYDCFRVRWEVREVYFEKTVIFTAPSEMMIDQVGVLDLSFPDSREVHFHDDCTLWHCPMCCYARHKKGGVYFGLEYPYWDNNYKMAFSPWITVAEGDEFVSEKAFIGAFAFTGKEIRSHGPYPGETKYKYHDILHFELGGLKQHIADNKPPKCVDIPIEVQDAGEIAAMREFFRYHLDEMPLPEDGYFVWQNGWWAGLSSPDTACIDVLEEAGVHDVLTAAIYFGHAAHPSTEPKYITDVRVDPLGFPTVKKSANVTTLEDGHHNIIEREETYEEDTEFTDTFSAPEDYEKLIEYGKSRGVHVTSFSTPNNAYKTRPDWKAVKADGTPYDYLGTHFSCPACREYMEHHFKVLTSVIDRYKPRLWAFDGHWMGFQEFAGYGYGFIGETPCYAEGHGHLPGKSRYMEWKNINNFVRRLRERYPTMCLEWYYGMKRGSTWALKNYNSDENYYEVPCADNLRFQTWHNENDRFRPTYMNFANIFAGNTEEFEYNIISTLSTSSYCQLANGYNNLRDSEESLAIYKKWISWANENSRYLHNREHLFGMPGDVPVDGSSHIIDGEGWVFLFNVTKEDQAAVLELSELAGLDDAMYRAEMIHPEVKTYEAIPADGTFEILMKPRTAALFKLVKV